MDPASLAFGIVSLAMQLVQTTGAIKSLISAHKSAAKELKTLADKLGDVEVICHSLEDVLSKEDDPDPSPWETSLLKRLHRTIHECYEKVSTVYNIIRKIEARTTTGHNPFRHTGFLFLQHRDEIVACANSLDATLSSLQCCEHEALGLGTIHCPHFGSDSMLD
ncbi:hypothetical protein ACHAP7_009469 [Fusarium lateritium]